MISDLGFLHADRSEVGLDSFHASLAHEILDPFVSIAPKHIGVRRVLNLLLYLCKHSAVIVVDRRRHYHLLSFLCLLLSRLRMS
jgi:hypothetical protein